MTHKTEDVEHPNLRTETTNTKPRAAATQEEVEEDLGLQELAELGNQWLKIDKAIRQALEEEAKENNDNSAKDI